VPDLLGARDDWSGLDLSGHERLAEIRRRLPGLRLTRTGLVFSALVTAIFGQKTTGRQARDSWRYLVVRYGAPAPGPAPQGLLVAPSAQEWGRIPSWAWHHAGVEPSRSRVIMRASGVAGSVDRLASFEAGDERVGSGLRSIPGVGVWTTAETTQRSHGDPDSVSIGDYHLSKDVGWALIGSPVDDDGMLELLEPWRGHRQRIVRLIEASGYRKPRLGPRITIQDHRSH
jgi:3-methyladenine DNA glycosylase/8-oxoguanine DNA glycosylase